MGCERLRKQRRRQCAKHVLPITSLAELVDEALYWHRLKHGTTSQVRYDGGAAAVINNGRTGNGWLAPCLRSMESIGMTCMWRRGWLRDTA